MKITFVPAFLYLALAVVGERLFRIPNYLIIGLADIAVLASLQGKNRLSVRQLVILLLVFFAWFDNYISPEDKVVNFTFILSVSYLLFRRLQIPGEATSA